MGRTGQKVSKAYENLLRDKAAYLNIDQPIYCIVVSFAVHSFKWE